MPLLYGHARAPAVRCDTCSPPFPRFIFCSVPFLFVSLHFGFGFRFGLTSCHFASLSFVSFRFVSFRFVFFPLRFVSFIGFHLLRNHFCFLFCLCRLSGTMPTTVRVLFADVEGQGDRDAAYDARLASAILPLTKCVVFNWRDSLQVCLLYTSPSPRD